MAKTEKDKILQYLTEQLEIKIDELKKYEGPINEQEQPYEIKARALQVRNSIYDLRGYISVIKML
ncbi:MAG: hypothetical protein KBF13_08920 [Prevotella sp.]|jgi:peptidoglycan hydrolase CwlO-like protein|nr:hypothetical protein [Prevotella sp.]MBP9985231.1 hypothetical protein [Prevotella sp.]